MLPFLLGRLWAFVAWALAALIFLFRSAGFVVFGVQKYGYAPVLRVLGVLLALLLLSLGFDVLYISITRWMLRRMLEIRRLHELVGLIVLDVVLAIVLVYVPIEMATAMMKSPLLEKAGVAVLLLVMFNFGDFVACSIFFIVMLAVLAHRLMWPILERPIYALHRYGVIRNKKLLWSVGSALLIGPQGFIALGKYIIQHFVNREALTRKINLAKVQASLDAICPKCGKKITPAERRHVDFEHIECPACGERFVPGRARA
jgi:predicted RNA-binding Zn-ribbon protein involved in translation (DUF1610 family)